MGAVKASVDTCECDCCGQLVMFDTLSVVSVADGPDDFVEQGMCEECAHGYEDLIRDEPEMEEECEKKP